jgi:hypothetical protein
MGFHKDHRSPMRKKPDMLNGGIDPEKNGPTYESQRLLAFAIYLGGACC